LVFISSGRFNLEDKSALPCRKSSHLAGVGATSCEFTAELERAGHGGERREGESPGSRLTGGEERSEEGAPTQPSSAHPPQPPTTLLLEAGARCWGSRPLSACSEGCFPRVLVGVGKEQGNRTGGWQGPKGTVPSGGAGRAGGLRLMVGRVVSNVLVEPGRGGYAGGRRQRKPLPLQHPTSPAGGKSLSSSPRWQSEGL